LEVVLEVVPRAVAVVEAEFAQQLQPQVVEEH
jgi:hypothetical protein